MVVPSIVSTLSCHSGNTSGPTTAKACAALFGNDKTRSGDFNPAAVLDSIATGGRFVSISFKDKGPSGYVAKTWPAGFLPIPGLAGKVSITINSFNGPGFWNAGNLQDNAETLLHELGHAFNFIRGAGGFPISNLVEIKDPYAFDKLVVSKCF